MCFGNFWLRILHVCLVAFSGSCFVLFLSPLFTWASFLFTYLYCDNFEPLTFPPITVDKRHCSGVPLCFNLCLLISSSSSNILTCVCCCVWCFPPANLFLLLGQDTAVFLPRRHMVPEMHVYLYTPSMCYWNSSSWIVLPDGQKSFLEPVNALAS